MLDKDFLWGGALAAHQFEGGVLDTTKGLSVADVMTAGAHGVPREITDGVIAGKYYPNHIGIDFLYIVLQFLHCVLLSHNNILLPRIFCFHIYISCLHVCQKSSVLICFSDNP